MNGRSTVPVAAVSGERDGWLAQAAATAVLLIVFLDLPNYLAALNDDFRPKQAYYLMLVVGLAVVGASRRFSLHSVRPAMLFMIAVYALLNLMHATLLQHAPDSQAVHEAWFRIQIVVLGGVVALSASVLPTQYLGRVMAWCASIAAISVVIDFVVPHWFYPALADGAVPGRAGGIMISSTRAGEVLIVCSLLALPALTPARAMLLIALVGVGVLMTLSRGAMTIWLLFYLGLWANRTLPRSALGLLILTGLIVASSAGLLLAYLASTNPASDIGDLAQRLGFLSGSVPTDDSAQERTMVLVDGLRLFADNPLFGAGVAATSEWAHEVGTHNQLVMMAAEYGLLGALGWLGLIGFCLSGSYFAKPSNHWIAAAVVVLFSMLTHGMLDYPFWIAALMLLAIRRPAHEHEAAAIRPDPPARPDSGPSPSRG
ncbi:MAG: O-antigen ligase family protein [Burkholderiaceae bacterium]